MITTVWEDIQRRIHLTPEQLGKLRKKQALNYLKMYLSRGGYYFDFVVAWRMARGGSPFVFIVGEPLSGKTTLLVNIAIRFSLIEWKPEEYYYAGGVEDVIREFVEGHDNKKYQDTVIAIDEGEGELDKWWSSLVKMLKLIHDLRGLHKRNMWAIVSPDITNLAKSLRGINGSMLVKVRDWGVATTYVIRRDPADVSGGLGIRRQMLDRNYYFEKPDDEMMSRIYELARRRKEAILKEEWDRYVRKKQEKEEEAIIF